MFRTSYLHQNKLHIGLFALAIYSFVSVSVTNVFAQTEKDPILQAMQAELNRSKDLHLDNMQSPYSIEYRIEDVDAVDASAEYGALTRQGHSHQRVLRVTVRIGDYKTDSSTAQGSGTVQLTATDDDVMAIRYGLWSATDEAYKNALRGYSNKLAALKGFQTPPTADDYSPAKPVTKIDPLAKLEIDAPLWQKRVAEASGWFAKDAVTKPFSSDIQYSTAGMRGVAVNRYLVNTEGAVVRGGYTYYVVSLAAGTQAPDGMRLDRSYGSTAATEKELDPWDTFRAKSIAMLQTLRDLRTAPIVGEDYHGPVLFSSDASADVFNRLFIPNVEADKPELGTTARTQGAYTASYKSRVLPDFMNVVDDPSVAEFAGKRLIGAYDVDDEGVPAQAVSLVTKGILQNYLIGRSPVKDFPMSNGHGRTPVGGRAQSRAGVTIFKSTEPIPAAQMEGKLLTMAKDQGRDAVYSVETLGPELAPRLLYRIDAATGKRQLVRGAVFEELDLRSLRSDILAAGDDAFIAQSIAGIPQTTIAPSLLFGEIGVKRATDEQQKLPYYAPPDSVEGTKAQSSRTR